MVRFKLNKFEYVQGGYVEGGPCMVRAGRGLWDQGPGTRDQGQSHVTCD